MSRITGMASRGDELRLGLGGGQPGDPFQGGGALGVQVLDLGGPLFQLALALVQLGRPVFKPVKFLVQPLFPVGQPVLPALQVAAQFADLVLDRPDLVIDLTPALGGLVGGVPGLAQDGLGFGFGAGPDLVGLAGRFLRTGGAGRGGHAGRGGQGGRGDADRRLRGLRGPQGARRRPAEDDDERKYRCEQPDHHERECYSTAHSHPFSAHQVPSPGTARALPGVMPWREGYCTPTAWAHSCEPFVLGRSHRPLAAAGRFMEFFMIIRAARSNTSLPRG
jgi:hypothetical protein